MSEFVVRTQQIVISARLINGRSDTLFGNIFVRRGFSIRLEVAFTKRVNNALAAEKLAFFAPLKQISEKRILEIDVLRTVAILLILLYHVSSPVLYEASLSLSYGAPLPGLLGVIGMSIFFFVSGLSLYVSNKTINNRREALLFYKKRVVRIYPLYWLFVGAILIFYRLSFFETLIYIAGLQALFYPMFISNPIYHFISVILIFYLIFPLIVFFKSYKKMLIASLVPLLILVAIKLYGQSDGMFLAYYGLFVGGIFAGEFDVYHKMRQATFRGLFVITLPLFVALASLYLICVQLYFNVFGLGALLNNFFGILMVLIILFWAIYYVKIYRTRFFALFTFVAFSTYGVFFLNTPFFARLSVTLSSRFHAPATATAIILIASIPVVVVAGYLLQFITNEIINVPKLSQKY